MKILEKSAGLLTNREVFKVLQEKGAAEQEVRLALPSERKVYEYLKHKIRSTKEGAIQEFKDAVTELNLTKSELVQLVNLEPTLPVEVVLVVDHCEERLGEEKVQLVLDVVEKTLCATE
ncbi:hypothetical protein BSKO_10976 [Bryopsis sp. KO-2023]|nr:hypothetical protein BSKO_10976 [Bryopsis sp. KO-2023]